MRNSKDFTYLLPSLGKEFHLLLARVSRDHKTRVKKVGHHHDIGHTFRVANTALKIAPDKKTARLAWLAAILHNTDRLFGNRNTPRILKAHLQKTPLTASEKEIVFRAVMNHTKKNDPNDDRVTVTLKDADRIADFGAIVLLRIGQYYHNRSLFDFVSPMRLKNSFGKEKTAVEDLTYVLEWTEKPSVKIRLLKAKHISKPGAEFMRQALNDIMRQLKSIGMYPLPATYKHLL
ncbi:MAG: HD domain-containing protein [Candidatus Liptonbacteria bacterium]|nr:HD domain-containing protein [Candidatus Liptonbacteria bacterium]